MTALPLTRPFKISNNENFKNRSELKTNSMSTGREPLLFGRIPYSSMKRTPPPTTTIIDNIPSTSSSPGPNSFSRPILMTPKRRSSTTSASQFLPRRKSLQMTALASQRQSLWISIAKNAQTNNIQPSPLPLRQQQQTNLIRKKLLRLLLVFSYLLSISLFAIALATFYGFFWTGYSTTQMSNIGTTVSSIVSLTSNTTLINSDIFYKNE